MKPTPRRNRVVTIRGSTATDERPVDQGLIKQPSASRRIVIIKNGEFVGGRPNRFGDELADSPDGLFGLQRARLNRSQQCTCPTTSRGTGVEDDNIVPNTRTAKRKGAAREYHAGAGDIVPAPVA